MNATSFSGSSSGLQTPFFIANISSAQTVNATGWTTISFNHVVKDTLNAYNTSTYRYQPTIAGYYSCTACVTLASSNLYIVVIFKTGNETSGVGCYPGYSMTPLVCGIETTGIIYLNGSSDYIDCRIAATSAASTVTPGTANFHVNRFCAHLIYAGGP